jgi:excinuclease ABC subunit A
MDRPIRIRGLRVHNLKGIDLDLPRGKLILISGVSGSGKSSLAFDTLFAEGQRRYIETFSAYTRQFLERIDRPDADSIDNIPPAIAIRQRTASRNSRSTVGSITEIADYLRLLYAKIGRVFCQGCGRAIRSDTPQSVLASLGELAAGTEFLVCFPLAGVMRSRLRAVSESLVADGFVRVACGDRILNLNDEPLAPELAVQPLRVVVDRLVASRAAPERVLDSIETAFAKGDGLCHVLVRAESGVSRVESREQSRSANDSGSRRSTVRSPLLRFSRRWRCESCDRDYPQPEPRLFNWNNPLGACPACRGFGDVIDIDMDRVVPDKSKSLRDGAIVPWNAPAYAHELDELLALADDYKIPVDIPFAELAPRHLKMIHDGVRERNFGGLRGFFNWLERKKYKMHIRVFLSRWRSYRTCPTCGGRRLRDVALATRVGGRNIAEVAALEVREAARLFESIELSDHDRSVGRVMLDQIARRLGYLEAVGLGYLTLDRPMRTLSGGEAQRVALTKALGAGLVNTLYVLDEPSIGLHERDTRRLVDVVTALRDSRNSVVVVEHDESFLRAADHLVDMGPGAGDAGGKVVYQGPLDGLESVSNSATADFLTGRRTIHRPASRRPPAHGWIRVRGARGNNLKNINVAFPLGVLCVVTGVSGSGKSTLVEGTLYAGLSQRLNRAGPRPADHDDIVGTEQLGDVVLVDQSPIGRSSRSNPVTYVKAFDEIRRAFAESTDARVRNYGPGYFSFNVEGGRCSACEGQGVQIIDMQFLADVSITCPECGGLRYRKEVLDAKYRGKSIAEVLAMSVREAVAFFRGRTKVVEALTPLLSVGLDYLKLGQPADTLSGGEAQRLKLAGQLAAATRQRTMLVLDEPTTGLHMADISCLVDCFAALIGVGHSLVVVEHNLELIKCADWIIDLGPEAAADGGRVVACGTPEQIASVPESHTGRFLARVL